MDKKLGAVLVLTLLFGTIIPADPQQSSYIAVQQDCDVIFYTDNSGNYFAQDCYDNTLINSGTDFGALVNNVVSNVPNHSVIKVKEGTYNVKTPITITKQVSFIGEGKDKTKFVGKSGIGSNPVIYINYPATTKAVIKGFTIDNSDSSIYNTAIGLKINKIDKGKVEDIYIYRGSIGLQIQQASLTEFEEINAISYTTYGIDMDGDNGAENVFINVQGTHEGNTSPTPIAGFRYTRDSNPNDNGGIYFVNCFFSGLGYGQDYGMIFEATDSVYSSNNNNPIPIYVWMSNNVASDGVDTAGLYLKNVAEIQITGSWVTATSTGHAIIAHNVHKLQILGHTLASGQEPILIRGTNNNLWRISSTLMESGSASNIFKLDTGASMKEIALVGVSTTEPHANIISTLKNFNINDWGTTLYTYPDIYTRSDLGGFQAMTIHNQNGKKFHVRMGNAGLQFLNETFVKPTFVIRDDGTIELTSWVFSGSCNPSCTLTIPTQVNSDYMVLFHVEKSSGSPEACVVGSRSASSFTLRCETTDTKTIRYTIVKNP